MPVGGGAPMRAISSTGEGVGLAFLLPRARAADIGAMAVEEMAGLVRHDEDHGGAEQLLEQDCAAGSLSAASGTPSAARAGPSRHPAPARGKASMAA